MYDLIRFENPELRLYLVCKKVGKLNKTKRKKQTNNNYKKTNKTDLSLLDEWMTRLDKELHFLSSKNTIYTNHYLSLLSQILPDVNVII